ncbi:MAG: response regulator [Pseudomonadota bacterium]|nr:response regulator [Pseudomonadota bacterium]
MNDEDEVVYVVDDDPAVRKGLARLLRSAGLTVATRASAAEFLALDHHQGVGCMVLDVRMPGVDGMAFQARLAARGVDLPIVFLTGHGDIPMSVEAMKQGAVDFLTKPVDEEVLLAAVHQALLRHRAGRTEREGARVARERVQSLTPRELDVLRCVITGARNKRIAAHLGIAEKTVKLHRGRVMKKLGLTTVAELVQACRRAGIEPGTGLKT